MGSIFTFALIFFALSSFAFMLMVCLILVEVFRLNKHIENIMIKADSSEKNITTSI